MRLARHRAAADSSPLDPGMRCAGSVQPSAEHLRVARLLFVNPRLDSRGLLRVTISHCAAELERQLWYPNPTDFPRVAERPESVQSRRYPWGCLGDRTPDQHRGSPRAGPMADEACAREPRAALASDQRKRSSCGSVGRWMIRFGPTFELWLSSTAEISKHLWSGRF